MSALQKDHQKLIYSDVEWLLENDPVFSKKFSQDYKIDRTFGAPDLASLIRIVMGQQISTKAAASLWQKFTTAFNPNDAIVILGASDDDLRACGLSRQKITYIRGLVQAVSDGTIDIASWTDKSDDIVQRDITSLKGFGPWSAQMFLMFNLCRRHIWPAGDLGIQIGLQRYYNLNDRPNEKAAKAMVSDFNGRETAAAFLLWDLKEDKSS